VSLDKPEPQTALYRANVGAVVFNGEGLALLCRRVNTPEPHNWQFPQGGVDPGEDLEAAARRELFEETGVRSVSLLAEAPDLIRYDFPPGYHGSKAARGYKGQEQKWFAYRFEGDESEINLDHHAEVEFDAWRWARLEEVVETIVPFKREAYRQVVAVFAHLALARR
jgi:putative (di)nucleoside polyphosphate hydrolase